MGSQAYGVATLKLDRSETSVYCKANALAKVLFVG